MSFFFFSSGFHLLPLEETFSACFLSSPASSFCVVFSTSAIHFVYTFPCLMLHFACIFLYFRHLLFFFYFAYLSLLLMCSRNFTSVDVTFHFYLSLGWLCLRHFILSACKLLLQWGLTIPLCAGPTPKAALAHAPVNAHLHLCFTLSKLGHHLWQSGALAFHLL